MIVQVLFHQKPVAASLPRPVSFTRVNFQRVRKLANLATQCNSVISLLIIFTTTSVATHSTVTMTA